MLTTDLLRVRVKEGRLEPRWLDGPLRKRAQEYLTLVIPRLTTAVGQRRVDVERSLQDVEVGVRDRIPMAGLRKLLEDRSVYEVQAPVEPSSLREAVFTASSRHHRALTGPDPFDATVVTAEVAKALGIDADLVIDNLYADLRQHEVLTSFESLDPEELLGEYNLALAQAALLKAVRVHITVRGETPERYRALFHGIRFHGLMHIVTKVGEDEFAIDLDGPFSLFDSVQKYGLRLALVLPHLVQFRDWSLRADVRWGRAGGRGGATQSLVLSLGPEDPLGEGRARSIPAPRLLPDLQKFRESFDKLKSPWTVASNETILSLPGEVVCIPDLTFRHQPTGQLIHMEVFGFWSRSAVFQRIELIENGLTVPVLLAAGKRLRVSEELLADNAHSAIYIYRSSPRANEVLERLDSIRAKLPAKTQ